MRGNEEKKKRAWAFERDLRALGSWRKKNGEGSEREGLREFFWRG